MPKPIRVKKVLVLNFRPPAIPVEWNNVDSLIEEYVEVMIQASHKVLVYKIVKKLDIPMHTPLMGGAQYNDFTWTKARMDDKSALRDARGNYLLADYQKIIQDYSILTGIQNKIIDEVWMFGGPYFGFYESRMIGKGAFWCNAPAIEMNSRRFVMMGFNYERSAREMLHSFCHRAESILGAKFGSQPFLNLLYAQKPTPAPKNEFETWLLEHGTVHRKPGGADYGQDEYEWAGALKMNWWFPVLDPDLVK
jgi:hypothetical protein